MTAVQSPDFEQSRLEQAITSRQRALEAVQKGSRWYIDPDSGVVAQPEGTWADGSDRLPNRHGVWASLLDPQVELRRCATDRKLLELHQAVPDHGRYSEVKCPDECDGQHSGPPVCASCRNYAGDPLQAPCPTIQILAEGYSWTPCGWNPIQASTDCDFDKDCPVHGASATERMP